MAEEKKEGMNYKKRYLGGVLTAIVVGIVVAWLTFWWIGIVAAIIAFFIVPGITTIPEAHRAVIERFGKYNRTLSPGLNLIFLPGIVEEIKEILYIEQKGTPIFEAPIMIDFKDGSASPKEAKVYTEIKNPDTPYLTKEEKEREKSEKRTGVYRAVYHIANREEEIVKTVQNAVRSYLNGLMLEEGIEMALGGYNLLEGRMPQKEVEKLEATLDDWGTRLVAVRIGDFDLEPDLVRVRGERHKKIKEREAAREVAERRAEETIGSLIDMFSKETGLEREVVQEQLRENPEEFIKKYKGVWEKNWDIIHRRMGIDGRAYLDIRTANPLLDLIALWRRMPMGEGEKEEKGSKSRDEELRERGRRFVGAR